MPQLTIKVGRKNAEGPAFPEITEETHAGNGELTGAAILEHGMASGLTGIGFVIELEPENRAEPQRKYLMVQTSKAILTSLLAAINGAEQHWKDNPL